MVSKREKLEEILHDLRSYSAKILHTGTEVEGLLNELKQVNPFDEKLFQTEKSLNRIRSKAEEYQEQSISLTSQINDKYLASQHFVPTDLVEQLHSLEILLKNIFGIMEDYTRAFKKAKTIRTEYYILDDKIKTWTENAELTLGDHNLDPSQLKAKLTDLTHEFSDMRMACDRLIANGNEIVKTNSTDKGAIQSNMERVSSDLEKIIAMIEDKNRTVDNILGNWANFMRLYQAVIDWSINMRSLLSHKLQLSTLLDAQNACLKYSVGIG